MSSGIEGSEHTAFYIAYGVAERLQPDNGDPNFDYSKRQNIAWSGQLAIDVAEELVAGYYAELLESPGGNDE